MEKKGSYKIQVIIKKLAQTWLQSKIFTKITSMKSTVAWRTPPK